MKVEFDTELLKENEGQTIGKAENYVDKFKKMGDSEVNNSTDYMLTSEESAVIPNYTVPTEYTESTEKEILIHYYKKFGSGSCEDFDKVSGKTAASINRLYKKSFTPEDILKKMTSQITQKDIVIKEELKKEAAKKATKVKVDIDPGQYPYIKDLPPLTEEQKDLCRFIDKGDLCFSSDGYDFYLAVKPNKADSFEKLFNFNDKEAIIFEMFKEQLGDEHKAKKLVLMSRKLNAASTKRPYNKKKIIKTIIQKPKPPELAPLFDIK